MNIGYGFENILGCKGVICMIESASKALISKRKLPFFLRDRPFTSSPREGGVSGEAAEFYR